MTPQQNLRTYRSLDAQNTGVVVQPTMTKLAGWHLYNAAATVRYVKLYDQATIPTSSSTPVLTLPVPAGAAVSVLGPGGVNFSAGLAIRCVTGLADNDNTGPTTNDVQVNLFYQPSGF